jgi:hypothetical protein
MMNDAMLIAIMLSVVNKPIMLSVIMQSVVAPPLYEGQGQKAKLDRTWQAHL